LLANYQKNSQTLLYKIYGDNCENASLTIEGEQDDNETILFPKDKNMEVFIRDRYGDIIEKRYEKEIIDKKEQRVCLKYTLFPNGSGSSYIVHYREKYYVFHPYFEETKVFDDKEEAVKNFLHNELYPKGADDYKNE